jgi:hypothetical protein
LAQPTAGVVVGKLGNRRMIAPHEGARMNEIDPDRNLTGQEARQGRIVGRGRVRLILITSLVLVIVGFVVAWMMV